MSIPCPICGAQLGPLPVTGPAEADLPATCPTCGHTMSSAYLAETIELGTWHVWAGHRLTWLHDRLVAGDLPAPGQAAAPVPPSYPPAPVSALQARPPARPARPPASAGSLLLAVGAFLLVVAGIAFIAFTWDLLGPFGQITLLLIIGAACIGSALRLATRLRGTSVAIGGVGVLLVVIAAIGARVLGPDLIGAPASLLASVIIGVALAVASVRLRPALAAVGELGAAAAALLVVTEVAFGPMDDAIALSEPWSWWVALTFTAGGVVAFSFADRLRLKSWPPIGAFFVVVAGLTWAVYLPTVVDAERPWFDSLVAALTLLAVAGVAGLVAGWTPHRRALATSAFLLWGTSIAVATVTGWAEAPTRPWAALLLLGAGGAMTAASVRVSNRGSEGAAALRPSDALWGLAVATTGLGVGLALSPWITTAGLSTTSEWAATALQPWRAVVAGTAISLLLVAAIAVDRRRRPEIDVEHRRIPMLAASTATIAWLVAAFADFVSADQSLAGPRWVIDDPGRRQVMIVFGLLGISTLTLALVRWMRRDQVWGAAAALMLATLTGLDLLSSSPIDRPETLGLALGIPALIGGASWWWLRRPQHTPTWQTMSPPFVLVLLPSTLALIDESTNRWGYGDDPSTAYQVRMVALLVIGAVAAVIGARQRWSGLFFPGLALVAVVVGIQLIDLGRFLPQWLSFAIAGAVLIAAGARWEWVRQRGKAGATWVRSLT